MTGGRKVVLLGLEVATPLAIVALWWWLSAGSTNFFIPPLSTIMDRFKELWLFERVPDDVVPSLVRFAMGYVLAVIAGLVVGLLLGLSQMLRQVVWPLVEFMRSIPPTALIPVGMLLIGIGDGMKIGIIALTCFFPVLLNTIDGVAGVDPMLLETADSYGLGRTEKVVRVVVPAAMPSAVAGMRISLPIALILMVVTEMVASSNGLGYFVVQAQRTFAVPDMWAGILLIGILGYVLNLLFVGFERLAIGWHLDSKKFARD